MFEDDGDQEILKALKKRKKSFEEVVNQKNIDKIELDEVMQEDF